MSAWCFVIIMSSFKVVQVLPLRNLESLFVEQRLLSVVIFGLSLDLSFASRPNIHFSENFAAAGIISRFTSHLRGLFTKYEARL